MKNGSKHLQTFIMLKEYCTFMLLKITMKIKKVILRKILNNFISKQLKNFNKLLKKIKPMKKNQTLIDTKFTSN